MIEPDFISDDGRVRLFCADCLTVLPQLEAGSVDLTVTSPPYDNLRKYNGYTFDFEGMARELYQATRPGGVVVWIVGDSVINGSESGNCFTQALYFKSIGFNLHDTMIYWKNAFVFPDKTRYAQVFEYMFLFSRGIPKTTNIFRVPTNRENQIKSKSSSYRMSNGATKSMKYEIGKKERNAENIWIYEVGYMKTTRDIDAFDHPAMFPEELATDHIMSWSNPGDVVLDPMMGSGTTGKMAVKLGRHFIGIEISRDYYNIAEKRIRQALAQPALFQI